MGKYFGTDGIRGVAGDTLSYETAYKVGRFVGYYFKKNGNGKIVIGKDTRQSSTKFEETLAKAINDSGSDAYLLGYCSTPCLAYVCSHDSFSVGVMISASHNPYQDNGIKIFGNDGIKLKDDIELLIEDYIDHPRVFEEYEKGKTFSYSKAIQEYQNWLIQKFPLDLKSRKICVDLCNGSNSYMAKDVLNKMNGSFTYINDAPNGTNINNHCGSTHLEMLSETVKNGDYEMGFAFDGDADRVLFVEEDGKVVDGDAILYLLGKYLKQKGLLLNNKIVITVMSNIGLLKALQKLDIAYDITPVGDKNVLDCMLKNNYCLGGEQSGHILCTSHSTFGDGLLTSLLLLESLSYYQKSLKEALSDFVTYPQLLINQRVKDKNVVLNDEEIQNKIEEIKNILKDEGRILVRPSGTESLIRVMVEAKEEELCKKYVEEVVDLIIKKGHALA